MVMVVLRQAACWVFVPFRSRTSATSPATTMRAAHTTISEENELA